MQNTNNKWIIRRPQCVEKMANKLESLEMMARGSLFHKEIEQLQNRVAALSTMLEEVSFTSFHRHVLKRIMFITQVCGYEMFNEQDATPGARQLAIAPRIPLFVA
jgi:hypothetical protein